MSSAVRATWRARSASGSFLIRRVKAQATAGATNTVQSAPSFASSSSVPVKARLETSSETVKPMPAQAPAVSSTGSLIGERGPCSAGRDAIHEPVNTPIGLPTTYPSRIPHVIGEEIASLISFEVMWIPALASANSGTIT